ncbi:MAG: ferrous iron transport protein A [Phenylobacterium sp.]|uniref:FeoA family protein n=1 Tax=Phenylobacterium sp. TaxID=1871053 RepID=UPI001A5F9999|nr:FeoA family protein [Phenylobacterium sp.]MBL8772522.1 ferrous iron transport protein A [Phenylobacterium sp.]
MHDMAAEARGGADAVLAGSVSLSTVQPGDRGVIVEVRADQSGGHGVDESELERRLLEFGFVEGARVELLHQGLIKGDPIAVRVDDMRVALRRRDAQHVWVRIERPEDAAR